MNPCPPIVSISLVAATLWLTGCSSGSRSAAEPIPALRLAMATTLPKADLFTGRVLDQNGKPVVGARIRSWREDPQQSRGTETNPEGYFALGPLERGHWHARAEFAQFVPSHLLEFTVTGSQPLPAVLFKLRAGVSLRVQLTDSQHTPIRHALLAVVAPDDLIIAFREAGKGTYESICGLPEGELTLKASAPGFSALEKPFSITNSPPVKTLELELSPAAAATPAVPVK